MNGGGGGRAGVGAGTQDEDRSDEKKAAVIHLGSMEGCDHAGTSPATPWKLPFFINLGLRPTSSVPHG